MYFLFQIIFRCQAAMNIKIIIKDANNHSPLLVHTNELSEVEFKKKNKLYQQPESDKHEMKKKQRRQKAEKQKPIREDPALKQSQQQMMLQLDKYSKQQTNSDMLQNSNHILQRQTQIIAENQKTLEQLVKNNHPHPHHQNHKDPEAALILKEVEKEVIEMKKIRDQIIHAGNQFKKHAQGRKQYGKQGENKIIEGNVRQMNGNLRNLAEISKNHLDGLENMEGIKSLQNFNMENYAQSIQSLKKQIVQYQKESQNIERELKLRTAKLQKLEISPNFEEELLQPYEKYLQKKADKIDMHSIKEKVYEKLGHYDYGKFEFDLNQLLNESKNEMAEFSIICKQHKISVPDIKIDAKQLKNLDVKMTSVLDQYKISRGIFNKPPPSPLTTDKVMMNETSPQTNFNPKMKTGAKIPKTIRELNSKPTNLALQVKLSKADDEKYQTVLETKEEKQRKNVSKKVKQSKESKEDQQFEKYLQNRAREELQILYQQKKNRLQQMQSELKNQIEEPVIHLNLNLKNQLKKDTINKSKPNFSEDHFEVEKPEKAHIKHSKESEKRQHSHQEMLIKEIGSQMLKEKLKLMLKKGESGKDNENNIALPENMRMEGMASNFISLINNTLCQVNNQLASTIQNKIEKRSLSKERNNSLERRSPQKIVIPKLEEFRAPPVFHLNSMMAQQQAPITTEKKPQKMVEKNYDHLRMNDEDEELQISDISENYEFQ